MQTSREEIKREKNYHNRISNRHGQFHVTRDWLKKISVMRDLIEIFSVMRDWYPPFATLK